MSDRGIFQAQYEDAIWQHQQLEQKYNRLIAALTPDGDTKAAYMGEIYDADFKNRPVSWTAIKAVMAMIGKESGL